MYHMKIIRDLLIGRKYKTLKDNWPYCRSSFSWTIPTRFIYEN